MQCCRWAVRMALRATCVSPRRAPVAIDSEVSNLNRLRHHLMVTEATDMRSLSHDARHERRVQVVRLRKAGQTYDEIAVQTGLSRTGVFDICKRHEAAGAKALRDAPSGRKSGDGRLLDAAQEAMVRKLLTDKTPDQLKMLYALWTRTAVALLIEHRFGIRLPVRTMGLYLARSGFTPQKPMKKAYEQVTRRSQEVARRGLPGHRCAGQGRGRRYSLG